MIYKAPVKIMISDRATRITARVCENALSEFERLNRRSFTKGSVGGIIQIKAYELVATHIGPRGERLSLYVTDFECIGAEGSGQFGVPRPIETVDQERKKLLQQLQDMRARERVEGTHDTSTPTSSVASPYICSQRAFQLPDDSVYIREETELATQMPCAFATEHNSKARKPSFPVDPGSRSVSSSPKKMLSERQSPVESNLGPFSRFPQLKSTRDQVSGNTTKSSHNQQRLLDILRQNQEATRSRVVSPVRSVSTKPQNSENPVSIEEEVRSHDTQTPRGARDLESGTPILGADILSNENDTAILGYKPNVVSPVVDSSDVSLHGIRYENQAPKPTQAVRTESDEAKALQKAQSSPEIYRKNKKRKIGNGISDREIKIGKDQDTLLARSECRSTKIPDSSSTSFKLTCLAWLPVQPGQRDLTANIPISILQTLNRQADSKALQTRSPNFAASDGHLHQVCLTQSSESDEPIPASDWPSSPIREVLPLDSSPPVGHNTSSVKKSQPSQSTPVRLHSVSDPPGYSPKTVPNENEAITAAQSELLPMYELSDSSTDDAKSQETDETTRRLKPMNCQLVQQQSPKHSCDADNHGNVSLDDRLETSGPQVDASTSPDDDHGPQAEGIIRQPYPCTASQKSEPFTQVKRTPHVDGDEQAMDVASSAEYPGQGPADLSTSPLEAEITHVTSTLPSLKSSSTPQMTAESDGPATKLSDMDCRDDAVPDADLEEDKHLSASTKLSSIADSEDFRKSRKRSTDSVLCPSQAKKRRTLPLLPPLDMTQIPEDLPDPAISARQYRRDWFAASRAARRDSASSLSKDSYASPSGKNGISLPVLTHEASDTASPARTPQSDHRERHSSALQTSSAEEDATKNVAQAMIIEDAVPLSPRDSLHDTMPISDIEYQIATALSGKGDKCPFVAECSPRSDRVRRPSINGDRAKSTSRSEGCNDLSRPLHRQSPLKSSAQMCGSDDGMAVFNRFKTTYPDYPGDIKHFKARLKNLSSMYEDGRLTPGYNLDDYIIRNKIEYARYLQLCAEEGDDPMSYDKFYHQEIAGPQYLSQVLSLDDLGNVSKEETTRPSSYPSRPMEDIRASSSAVNGAASKSPSLVGSSVNEANGDNIIDLTNDKPALPRSTEKRDHSVRRSLPWMETPANEEPHDLPIEPPAPIFPGVNLGSQVPSARQERTAEGFPAARRLTTRKIASSSLSQKSSVRSAANDKDSSIHTQIVSRPAKVSFDSTPAIIGSKPNAFSATQEFPSSIPVTMTSIGAGGLRTQSVRASDPVSANHVPQTSHTTSPEDNFNSGVDVETSRLEGEEFWRDKDSPFRIFVRAYEGIQPGKGNAWATPEQVQWGKEECERRKFHPRGIDVLSWHL